MTDRRRTYLLPAIVFFLITGLFLLLVFRMTDVGLNPLKVLFSPVKTTTSWSILQEIKDMEELETAAYEMRVVFPFDFTGEDEVDWRRLKYQYDSSPSQFLQKTDPAWFVGGVLPPEWKHAEIYYLCRQAGIDPGRPDNRFLVLSTSIRAGINLKVWLDGFTESGPESEVEGIQVSHADDGSSSLLLTAPPIEILSFSIEDRDATADGYPDIPVSPEEWSVLVSGLEDTVIEMALTGGLLERADAEGRSFLAEIFTAAGYDHVGFIER